MSHFAKLDITNKVIFVLVGREEDDGKEIELCQRTGDRYVQTSYNTRGGVHYQQNGQPSVDQSKAFRKNFAGIGFTYDPVRNAFIPPNPGYPSWTLDEFTCQWVPPVPMPTDGMYVWDEAMLNWRQIGTS
jgi:hypothetical protein